MGAFVLDRETAQKARSALAFGDWRWNVDGFLGYSRSNSGSARDYVQIFHSGGMEVVKCRLFQGGAGVRFLPSIAYEGEIIREFARYCDLLRGFGVGPPLVVMLSLLGVKGCGMWLQGGVGDSRIDRDAVLIPDITVDDYSVKPEHILRPVFDAVWQATGYHGSPNYDKHGNWVRYDRQGR
jgi:hypothetical protein